MSCLKNCSLVSQNITMIKATIKEIELPRIAMATEVSFSKPFSICLYKFFIPRQIVYKLYNGTDPEISGLVSGCINYCIPKITYSLILNHFRIFCQLYPSLQCSRKHQYSLVFCSDILNSKRVPIHPL